jgi:hypothetical protein
VATHQADTRQADTRQAVTVDIAQADMPAMDMVVDTHQEVASHPVDTHREVASHQAALEVSVDRQLVDSVDRQLVDSVDHPAVDSHPEVDSEALQLVELPRPSFRSTSTSTFHHQRMRL